MNLSRSQSVITLGLPIHQDKSSFIVDYCYNFKLYQVIMHRIKAIIHNHYNQTNFSTKAPTLLKQRQLDKYTMSGRSECIRTLCLACISFQIFHASIEQISEISPSKCLKVRLGYVDDTHYT